jgi:hypothetical protein
VGETVLVTGVPFQVVGVMARKIQLSNYFSSDDDWSWIPYSTFGDLWSHRYGAVLVFEPIAPQFEKRAMAQVLAAVASRQQFSPTDQKAIQMFGREEFRPIIDGLTIGLQVLLTFIGTLTLGIGGVGVMNIMLVSVDERIREIGLRRALGARKRHIRLQFLAETLLIMLLGGAIGILISYVIAASVGTLPMMGPLFEDESGNGDIHLKISIMTVLLPPECCYSWEPADGAGVARFQARSGGGFAVRVRALLRRLTTGPDRCAPELNKPLTRLFFAVPAGSAATFSPESPCPNRESMSLSRVRTHPQTIDRDASC